LGVSGDEAFRAFNLFRGVSGGAQGLVQGTLTEGEASVRLTSSLGKLVLLMINNIFYIKMRCSRLASTRRYTVLSLSLH
jgi:hypothetical protein